METYSLKKSHSDGESLDEDEKLDGRMLESCKAIKFKRNKRPLEDIEGEFRKKLILMTMIYISF
jgi:hypothetical protein